MKSGSKEKGQVADEENVVGGSVNKENSTCRPTLKAFVREVRWGENPVAQDAKPLHLVWPSLRFVTSVSQICHLCFSVQTASMLSMISMV